jgi:hypothetical protein
MNLKSVLFLKNNIVILRILVTILNLFIIIGCHSNTNAIEKIENKKEDCPPGKDTINIENNFTKSVANSPSKRFYSIVDLIVKRKFFKPRLDKVDKLFITQRNALSFPLVYDTCNNQRQITKNIIIKNIQVTELDFKAIRPDKLSDITPWLHFEEWQFLNNSERDSALKIISFVYNYPNTLLMYQKRYSQFIIDEKKIYLLESRAKFAEQYAIDYKKIIEKYIAWNK